MSLDTAGNGPGGSGFSTGDGLGDAFYPLYDRLFSEDSEFVKDVERKLAESRMPVTVEMYLSRALAIGVISGGVLWALGMLIGYALASIGIFSSTEPLLGMPVPNQAVLDLIQLVKIPALVIVTGLVFGAIGFGIGFGTLVAVPYSRSSARKREINMLLPDAVSFMYALSIGGLNQLEILEAMARAEDTYGEVAREFQSIVQETEYFDTDYRSAIRNQSMNTPSDELSQFLTDMLSIVNSGGDMQDFLDDKKEKHMRTAKQQQELTLETLELFGEMYMTLSLFPLLLIIILVIMQMMGQSRTEMLYGTVYGMIPLTGLGFLVLVSTVKEDEVGDGFLNPKGSSQWVQVDNNSGLLDLGLVEEYTGEFSVFDRIKNREGTRETLNVLRRPHIFFRDNPLMTLALTVPAALVIISTALVAGSAPTSLAGMKENPVWGTFVYVYLPLYIILIPLTVFYEWNVHYRKRVLSDISENLRKLSSANDTGLTLLESFNTVAETSTGKLATEFEMMYAKVNYGMNLRDALVEFNNKYHVPRLSRTVKLISKAQEASSQISDVLTTAAQASENQDDIARERKSRTRMQMVIIVMTYLTLLAVMAILQTQFLDVMAGLTDSAGGGGGGGGPAALGANVDTQLMSMLFFHAVTMQAILSGLISGYIRDAELLSGGKFVVVLVTIALAVWAFVG
ncbi:flagellar protein FlaJ [Natronoarchaeum philippinense]|uniref:Flagellar protein FlaJ n=1 Tax=Natronoarchaeum philippinense TaxID=558529 RepID=A0A285NWE8_NATPI|nr:type II secretion system F family protein [Natronoarchaeum philippinense]SNZ13367.1 flagellar protein FlaJ [Natronoarchaeum philippinense]